MKLHSQLVDYVAMRGGTKMPQYDNVYIINIVVPAGKSFIVLIDYTKYKSILCLCINNECNINYLSHILEYIENNIKDIVKLKDNNIAIHKMNKYNAYFQDCLCTISTDYDSRCSDSSFSKYVNAVILTHHSEINTSLSKNAYIYIRNSILHPADLTRDIKPIVYMSHNNLTTGSRSIKAGYTSLDTLFREIRDQHDAKDSWIEVLNYNNNKCKIIFSDCYEVTCNNKVLRFVDEEQVINIINTYLLDDVLCEYKQ
jgi:hypothetical protein